VHDARDLLLVERAAESRAVGYVARHARHTRELVLAQDQPEARVVVPQVVADRILALIEQCLERPRADAAERAGDERPGRLSQAGRPGKP
jgi:hypothetical protein